MWKFLYQMASPQRFFNTTQPWLPWLGAFGCVFLIMGFIWGLVFAPADYQQGDAFRIIYIHVPAAFLSLSLYAFMAFLAVLLLVWRIKLAGIMLSAAAQTGASMALIALVTGSIWGKPMWGTWWVWDARLTSELILLILYIAILATGATFRNKEQADRLVAVLTLVGVIDLPIIHYSVYWWNTLHQGATLSLLAKPKIALPMLYPLLFTLAGFSFFCLWVMLHKASNELLIREKRQQWVRKLLEGNV
ncbi:heme exporter protein CcmC [Legionella birminghamensis]|uniref:Heme exporter protein C n=1 Tax=Legionella birminghamensis TaxID=28083 RepID=A0A378I909_9GAMM|nr:heme ABC transporter permease CcmC [Legionella birminghamensis]KTC67959.1 heme exporter protein CcmC [Legionella birminghamensis]STX31332.1 heme exporter protein CcmC [Legionella birminghamensis]